MSLNEIQVLQKLKHLNLTTLFKSFLSGSNLCLVFDYCSRGSLLTCIRKHPPKALLLYEWIYQLLSAVSYIHSKGIVHQYIKLENILISREENLKLTDFGISEKRSVVFEKQNFFATFYGT
jgi:serine/threonine protein kinase